MEHSTSETKSKQLLVFGRNAQSVDVLLDKMLKHSQHNPNLNSSHKTLLLTDSWNIESEATNLDSMLKEDSRLILNLEDIGLARFASQTNQPIFWFCTRDPKEFLGSLLERFQGSFWSEDKNQIVFQTDVESEHYPLGGNTQMDKQLLSHLLAAVCTARTLGVSDSKIRTFLNVLNYTSPGKMTTSAPLQEVPRTLSLE